MELNEILERKDINDEFKWDLESMYDNLDKWNSDYEKAEKLKDDFETHRGNVSLSSENLYRALKDREDLYRVIENMYSYAHMKLDEDTRNSTFQELSDRAMNLYVEISDRVSFVTPEILTIDEGTLEKYIEENDDLKLYRQLLEDIFREKKHVLSAREESILAQFGEVVGSSNKIFSMLNDADLKFPKIKDENGVDVEITSGNFIPLMESKNREVRKAAFTELYKTYNSFKNTFAASLNVDLKGHIVNSQLRNYENSRQN